FRAFGEKNHWNRAPKNNQIEPDGPVVDVFQIEPDPFLEVGQLAATADLPEASEAWFDAEAAAMREIVETFDFLDPKWTRADEAHFAFENVEHLGPLIEARFAEKLSN